MTFPEGVGNPRRAHVAPVPFGAAVALSLVLHVGFFCTLPSLPERSPPAIDAVVVDLAPPPELSPPVASAPVPGRRTPAEVAAAPGGPSPSAPPQEPEPAAPPRGAAESRTPSPPAAAPAAAGAPEPPPLVADARGPGKLTVPVPRERPPAPAASKDAKPQQKTLSELMPSSKELAHFRSGKLPDPAGGGAREATLGLGENDVRYQGYVDRVRTEILAGWHMGRGLVVAGNARRVMVRFSLNSLGMVDTPTVVQSSGNPTLDAEAVDAVRRAKLAPFPNQWTLERLYLYAVFDYEFR